MENAVSSVTAAVASGISSIPEPPRISFNRDQLLYFSIVITALSSIFWIWALKNTVTQHFDLGIISFFTVWIAAVAAICLHFIVNSRVAKWQPIIFRLACGFVSLNYLLGVFTGGFFFRLYCLIGTLFWAAVGYYGGKNYTDAYAAVVYPDLV
eukprot:CFRG6426T1